MKFRWLILLFLAGFGAVAWLLVWSDSSGRLSQGKGDAASGRSSHAAATGADTPSREKGTARKANDSEARQRALKEHLIKRLRSEIHSDLAEEVRMQVCRDILAQLGEIADFHEVLALLDGLAATPGERSQLLPTVFTFSRQKVPELVAAAKEMNLEDRSSGIGGIADKIQFEKLPASEYATVHELVSGPLVHSFSVMLDLDLIRQGDKTSQEKRLRELAAVSRTLPADRQAGFDVAVASVARIAMPELAWETLSGQSSAGMDAEELRAETVRLMMEREPYAAMSTLLRGRENSTDELVTSLTEWLSRDPAGAKAWYADNASTLMFDRAERLAKVMRGQ
jgi:hypothetical protein